MHVVLIMVRENGQRRSFALTRDVTVIGRREDADFRIPLTDVSRKHCRLVRDGSTLVLEDLGSSNGTLRNGERIKECELEPGDTLQIGPIQFVVQIDGVPAEDDVSDVPRSRSASPAANAAAAAGERTPPPAPPEFGSAEYDLASDNQPTIDRE